MRHEELVSPCWPKLLRRLEDDLAHESAARAAAEHRARERDKDCAELQKSVLELTDQMLELVDARERQRETEEEQCSVLKTTECDLSKAQRRHRDLTDRLEAQASKTGEVTEQLRRAQEVQSCTLKELGQLRGEAIEVEALTEQLRGLQEANVTVVSECSHLQREVAKVEAASRAFLAERDAMARSLHAQGAANRDLISERDEVARKNVQVEAEKLELVNRLKAMQPTRPLLIDIRDTRREATQCEATHWCAKRPLKTAWQGQGSPWTSCSTLCPSATTTPSGGRWGRQTSPVARRRGRWRAGGGGGGAVGRGHLKAGATPPLSAAAVHSVYRALAIATEVRAEPEVLPATTPSTWRSTSLQSTTEPVPTAGTTSSGGQEECLEVAMFTDGSEVGTPAGSPSPGDSPWGLSARQLAALRAAGPPPPLTFQLSAFDDDHHSPEWGAAERPAMDADYGLSPEQLDQLLRRMAELEARGVAAPGW